MKCAVLTMLGLVNGKPSYPSFWKRLFSTTGRIKKADIESLYLFNNDKCSFVNMFPLLISQYKASHEIVALGTPNAQKCQKEVLQDYYPEFMSTPRYVDLKDTEDFPLLFAQINAIIDEYDEVIVDITHGFRHIPMMAFLVTLMTNLRETGKIKHIFYAKIDPKEGNKPVYRVVRLEEYIDIMGLVYALNAFVQTLVVAGSGTYKNEAYNRLFLAMREFSDDLLGLSLRRFMDTSYPKLIDALDALENDSYLKQDGEKLKKQLKNEFGTMKEKDPHLMLLDLSETFLNRNYLTQVALLNDEAFGFLLIDYLKRNNPIFSTEMGKKEADILENPDYTSYYKLTSDVRNLFLKACGISQYQMTNSKVFLPDLEKIIVEQFAQLERRGDLQSLSKGLVILRNTIAHANFSKTNHNLRERLAKQIEQLRDLTNGSQNNDSNETCQ